MKKLFIATALFFSCSAFAEECFDSNYIRNWDYNIENESVSVETFDGNFNIQAIGCFQLNTATEIGFRSFFASQVCRGDKLVVYSFGRPVESCSITSITKQ